VSEGNRYLVISELFLPTKGGTAVWFDEVYRRLGGKEIHIVTADVPGAQAHDRDHPNTVHRVRLHRHWWLRPESLLVYAKFTLLALFLAARHRFDAVHAGRVLPEGLAAWVVARARGLPLVVYAHGEEITGWKHPRRRRAMAFVYRSADRVIANSEFTCAELHKLGVKPERITVIYPGVDVQRFRPGLESSDLRAGLGLAPGQKLILSVGRLSRRKGFDQVIRCLPELAARGLDVHYAIVGIGEDHGYLLSLARDLDVSERVHLLGHVEAADLPRWCNAADVFAMPNRDIAGDTEGFGMVFLEAAACGKPSVAGDAGGTGAAVVDGETGYRVDGESVEAVAGVLERLLMDESLNQRMGENGLKRAARDFSWEAVAARTAALADPMPR